MDKDNYLDSIRQSFRQHLPSNDKRAKIQMAEFIPALTLCFSGDSKTFSLEAIRRSMTSLLGVDIPRSTFWDRLSTSTLTTNLQNILGYCMGCCEIPLFRGETLLTALNVKSIQLIDSSSISLWDKLSDDLPGTRTTAGVKWHLCFDLLTGMMTWFNLSSTSSNDRQHFPDIDDLRNVLTIFDLGYFDYGLLKMIDDAEGFFLSRIKKNSNIKVLHPIEGVGKKWIGCSVQDIRPGSKIIDFLGEVICPKHGRLELRIIGLWNPEKKIYHWYTTNLLVDAKLIYPLYRCRWQIELFFKGCKRSLNLNEIPTGNKNIVMNLLLASILAYIVSLAIVDIAKEKLNEEEREAITFQRISKVMVHLSFNFALYFFQRTGAAYRKLRDKIYIFVKELIDPNLSRRKTSLQQVMALC